MSDEWVKAKNLINQQTQIMVNELGALEARVANQARSIDILQRERDAAVDRMERSLSETERVRLSRLAYENGELRRENAKFREFMKLKDNAKTKVEQKRDYLRTLLAEKGATIGALNDEIEEWKVRVTELEAQNARQAQEFQQLRDSIIKKDEMIRKQSAENGRLIDVIKLGRKGIEGEGRDWELGYSRGYFEPR